MQVEGESDSAKNGIFYLLTDHLGSNTVTLKDTGSLSQVGELRYMPWGNNRASGYAESLTPTDKRFTGQRWEAISSTGLYHHAARWYDPLTGRFTQPDTIVPDPYNAQDWDRYAYVRNNPAKFTDPSGHCIFGVDTVVCLMAGGALVGAAVAYGKQVYDNYQEGATGIDAWVSNVDGTKLLEGAVIGAGVVVGGIAVGTVAMAGATAMGAAGTAACADGDCTNEVQVVGQTFVRDALPKLEGSVAKAFDGTPVLRTLQPGTLIYRAEAAAAQGPGYWFGTQATQSAARADRWWNIIKWGNPREVMRTYEVLQEVTVYYGKVAQGRGTQILIPRDVPLDDVVRRVGETLLK